MHERHDATVMTFGDLLRRLRKRAGMTQDDLAAAIVGQVAGDLNLMPPSNQGIGQVP